MNQPNALHVPRLTPNAQPNSFSDAESNTGEHEETFSTDPLDVSDNIDGHKNAIRGKKRDVKKKKLSRCIKHSDHVRSQPKECEMCQNCPGCLDLIHGMALGQQDAEEERNTNRD
ncbi:hypothetical protein NX059_005105 [Plenodomus lindquistii]|nr:hypothetical protein NX059_005105 [Plenodomus lindquistii]